jgi:hypothetical protein
MMKTIALALAGCCAIGAGGAAAQDYQVTRSQVTSYGNAVPTEGPAGEYRLSYKLSATLPQRITVPGVVTQLNTIEGGDLLCEGFQKGNPEIFDFAARLTTRLAGETGTQLQALLRSLEGEPDRLKKLEMLFFPGEASDVRPKLSPLLWSPNQALPPQLITAQRWGQPVRLELSAGVKCVTPAQVDAAIAEGRRMLILVLENLKKSGSVK